MEETEEKAKGFKVQDKRRFSPEGELKPEHRSEAQEPAAAPQPQGGPEPAAGAESRPPRARPEGAAPEINFSTFVVSLSTQALMHLGEVRDPAAKEASVPDLPAAQQLIDILGMLQEKTRGNLDRDEASLLESMLFDLRMKYVEIARKLAR